MIRNVALFFVLLYGKKVVFLQINKSNHYFDELV